MRDCTARQCRVATRLDLLTIVNLLQRNLGVVGEALLGLSGQHEGLWLLRGCHYGTIVRVHDCFEHCRRKRWSVAPLVILGVWQQRNGRARVRRGWGARTVRDAVRAAQHKRTDTKKSRSLLTRREGSEEAKGTDVGERSSARGSDAIQGKREVPASNESRCWGEIYENRDWTWASPKQVSCSRTEGRRNEGRGETRKATACCDGGEEASEGGQGLCTRGLRAARATGRDAGALEGLRRMCRSDGAGQAQGRRRPVGCRPAGAWASEAPAGGPVIPYRYGCLSSASLGWKPRLTPAAARREHQPWSVARRGRQQPGRRHLAYTVPAY